MYEIQLSDVALGAPWIKAQSSNGKPNGKLDEDPSGVDIASLYGVYYKLTEIGDGNDPIIKT